MFVDEEPDACDRHFSRYVLFLVVVDGARCFRRVLPQWCLLLGRCFSAPSRIGLKLFFYQMFLVEVCNHEFNGRTEFSWYGIERGKEF